ncbi:MAG: dihydroorotase [Actinobacteria bacterium]|nr:dihydroorotase [Actinomycetota bacterium]
MNRKILKGGLIFNIEKKRKFVADILIEGNSIMEISDDLNDDRAEVIDMRGRWLMPAFIDPHAHLREPGREDEETIESGITAAINGGFCAVACMPNTDPAIDDPSILKFVLDKSRRFCPQFRLLPIAAITRGREGKELSEIGLLKSAGAVAFSDDGSSVVDTYVMRRALEYGNSFGVLFILHEEDLLLSQGGQMHEGYYSTLLGLKGIPWTAEATFIARDLLLALDSGSKVHFAHVSSARSVEIINFAKNMGADVSAEVNFHNLVFCDEDLKSYDTNLKINPPMRSSDDREALIAAARSGQISMICSDHAPHASHEKELDFDLAPFGAIGLDLMPVAVFSELVFKKKLDEFRAIEMMTSEPAKLFGLGSVDTIAGSIANIAAIDPNAETVVDIKFLQSKSKNTPFLGKKLKSSLTDLFLAGTQVKKNGEVLIQLSKSKVEIDPK